MPVAIRAVIQNFRYRASTVPALADIDLTVEQGEFVIVTGRAGSGKTTLCYCLSGAIPKSVNGEFEGRVEVLGKDLSSASLPELSSILTLVIQSPENQLFNIMVNEDVAFGPENLNLPPEEVRDRIRRSLEFTGTSHLANRFSHLLSGGESQRVVVASSLALEPEVYVLDQPAAELDPDGRRSIYQNIYRLSRDAGKTIVLVEDRLRDVVSYADRILLLDHGRIVHDSPPKQFFSEAGMADYGVRIPDSIQLYHRLVEGGIELNEVPLSVSEVVEQIREAVPPRALSRLNSPPISSKREELSSAHSRAAIEFSDVSYHYPFGVEALSDISLTVPEAEFVAIVGPNGAGKTTLAKHIVGLLRPSKGRVHILGAEIRPMPVHRISERVGFLFQDPDYQTFNNSCLEEVSYGLKRRGLPEDRIRDRAVAALDRLGLTEHLDDHPYTLSRGQRQRLAVASVLASEPPILVVDEPATALDYHETVAMMELLEEYVREGRTVVIITHDMEMAIQYARRVIVMSRGRTVHDLPAIEAPEHMDDLGKFAVLLPDIAAIVRELNLHNAFHSPAQLARAILHAHGAPDSRGIRH